MLCLHQAGAVHLGAAPIERGGGEAGCVNELGEACDRSAEHPCDWCVDVEIRGIDLAQLRLDESVEVTVPVAATGEMVSAVEWGLPSAVLLNCAPARAPPALSEALIVAKTTVLLL